MGIKGSIFLPFNRVYINWLYINGPRSLSKLYIMCSWRSATRGACRSSRRVAGAPGAPGARRGGGRGAACRRGTCWCPRTATCPTRTSSSISSSTTPRCAPVTVSLTRACEHSTSEGLADSLLTDSFSTAAWRKILSTNKPNAITLVNVFDYLHVIKR